MNPHTTKNPTRGVGTKKRYLRPATQSLMLYVGAVALALGGAAISIASGDGTVVVKLARKVPSPECEPATVAGAATTVAEHTK